ncbi:MAG: class I SAM-dependent methyltransferase [Proteobacteria bacterium]|nr:class I SAM-dependent methyltransferase [Pseudomonadota bacterium]
MKEQFKVHLPENQTAKDGEYHIRLADYFDAAPGGTLDKLRAFTKHAPVAEIGRFLAKSKLFESVLSVHGSIIECGVFMGGGVMTWANLSAILEPLNHIRKVIGFDTFSGFVDVTKEDISAATNDNLRKGGLKVDSYEDLQECVRIFDIYRPLGHIPKVELVKGDALESIPAYIEANQHLIVALLYLDFDLYAPTKAAIEAFLPRMPKGAIVAFDQLGMRQWPGETRAVMDSLGLRELKLQRFPFQPQISFAVL